MRSGYLLLTLLVLSASAPARAQLATATTKTTPDMVVARVMSFDRNGDGRVVAGELPERMQNLVTRGDTGNDRAIDAAEARRLAMSPARQVTLANGLQPGRYGFVDGFSFDSSRHIEGALDDLRLSADTRDQALQVARKFLTDAEHKALDDLLATMGSLLTPAQMEDFLGAVRGKRVSVPAIKRDGVLIFGATAEEAAGQERVMVSLREGPSSNLERQVEQYDLPPGRRQQAIAAVRQYKTQTTPHQLTDVERRALVDRLVGLLTAEQREDLGAALARRPVVQLSGVAPVVVPARVIDAPAVPGATPSFVVQHLLQQ
jgi:hypothetical protein